MGILDDMKLIKAIVPLADGVEEIEAVTIVDVLRRAGVEVETAALDEDSLDIEGAHGIGLVADATLDECDAATADAIILPGGMKGMLAFKADERIRSIIKDFNAKGKLVAALCAAPIVLADVGILKGRKAVCFPSERGDLVSGGAVYQEGAGAVRDGNIITGSGAGTAMEFALKVVEALTSADAANSLAEKMLFKRAMSME